MTKWLSALAMLVGLFVVVAPYIAPSLTNTIVVHNRTTAAEVDLGVTADSLKPAECVDNILDEVVTNDSGADVVGSDANELVLGAPSNTTFNAGAGDDCVKVPETGTITIDGGDGNDVCLGNATTTFANCELRYIDGVMQ